MIKMFNSHSRRNMRQKIKPKKYTVFDYNNFYLTYNRDSKFLIMCLVPHFPTLA